MGKDFEPNEDTERFIKFNRSIQGAIDKILNTYDAKSAAKPRVYAKAELLEALEQAAPELRDSNWNSHYMDGYNRGVDDYLANIREALK